MALIFNKIFQKQRLQKRLMDLLNEMEKNLEVFYVMDQRQFITHGFILNAWENIKEEELLKKYPSIHQYAKALADFNNLFNEYKEFEQWYTADMSRKTADNAKKLHGLKHDLDKQLKMMEAIIIPAGQDLEKEMLQLGFLKAWVKNS